MSRYSNHPKGWSDTGHRTVGTKNEVWSGNPIKERSYMHGIGTVVAHLSPPLFPMKSMCVGCNDDHYNQPGNSVDGECWGFKTAKVCDKIGHSTLNVENGPDTIMRETLSCWHAVSK